MKNVKKKNPEKIRVLFNDVLTSGIIKKMSKIDKAKKDRRRVRFLVISKLLILVLSTIFYVCAF